MPEYPARCLALLLILHASVFFSDLGLQHSLPEEWLIHLHVLFLLLVSSPFHSSLPSIVFIRADQWPIFLLGSTDPTLVPDKRPSPFSFSISPSKSTLDQSLSFPFAREVQDDAGIASSCCATEGEQKSKEDLSKAPEKSPAAPDSSPVSSLLDSLSLSNFTNLCLRHNRSMLLLSSAPPALSTP